MKLKNRIKLGLRAFKQGEDIEYITDFIQRGCDDLNWKYFNVGCGIGLFLGWLVWCIIK